MNTILLNDLGLYLDLDRDGPALSRPVGFLRMDNKLGGRSGLRLNNFFLFLGHLFTQAVVNILPSNVLENCIQIKVVHDAHQSIKRA